MIKFYQDLLLKDWSKFMINQKKSKFKQRNQNQSAIIKSDLCDISDADLVVEEDITLEGDNDANKRNKNLAFKNNAPFINCISKINGVKIDNAEDLDVVMPMYNLLEYSKNYRKTTGSLWNYYRDEPSDPLSSNSKSLNTRQVL